MLWKTRTALERLDCLVSCQTSESFPMPFNAIRARSFTAQTIRNVSFGRTAVKWVLVETKFYTFMNRNRVKVLKHWMRLVLKLNLFLRTEVIRRHKKFQTLVFGEAFKLLQGFGLKCTIRISVEIFWKGCRNSSWRDLHERLKQDETFSRWIESENLF